MFAIAKPMRDPCARDGLAMLRMRVQHNVMPKRDRARSSPDALLVFVKCTRRRRLCV
jgi:hypothetical protein